MILEVMRAWAEEALTKPVSALPSTERRIHPSFPQEPYEPTTITLVGDISDYCAVGPHTNHNFCVAVWCKCGCHDANYFCGM